MNRCSPPAAAGSEPIGRMPFDDSPIEADAEAVASDPSPGTGSKKIPAAVFAALVGRGLRTLRNWDEAGLTHPEMRGSRRYYDATDLAAVLVPDRGRRGPREGSVIKYMGVDWDNGI